ncbi:LEA type 2 family protein [Palaeococcus ferrophilus]|uniref:LEA type 2 family protein n=1 Tax=Palaeococcus ferrophilus TaxID=83868 RepID=UPI00064F91AE|nr:LEA type 2 family protein [Palaeococcus ferrophilus]
MRKLLAVGVLMLLVVSLASGCIGSGNVKEKIGEKVETLKPQILSVSHRWGEITPTTSEVITEIVVSNPNSIPIPIKNISVHLYMNGVDMGAGKNVGPASLQPKANTTIVLLTKIDNTKIPKWWVSHLRNGEKTDVLLKGSITFDLKVTDFEWPFEQRSTVKTDILSGLQFKNVPIDIDLKLASIRLYANVTSRLDSVEEGYTQISHTVVLYNTNKLLPVAVSGIAYEVYMNDIKVGEGEEEKSALIPPQSTATFDMNTIIENGKLDNWWVSHLKNGEKTKVVVQYYFVFRIGDLEVVRIPFNSMESEIKTNVLGS